MRTKSSIDRHRGARGATTIEYALLVLCLSVSSVASIVGLSSSALDSFDTMRLALGGGTVSGTSDNNDGQKQVRPTKGPYPQPQTQQPGQSSHQ